MLTDDFTSYFQKLDYGLRKIRRKLEDFDIDNMYKEVAESVKSEAKIILRRNLGRALLIAQEFQYPELKKPLYELINHPDLVRFSREGVYLDAYKLGGNEDDYTFMVLMARYNSGLLKGTTALEGKKSKSGEDLSLVFWRERIYKPAREGVTKPPVFKHGPRKKYKRDRTKTLKRPVSYDYVGYALRAYKNTIERRLKAKPKIAPHWIMVEYGTSYYAYPKSTPPTNFMRRSEAEINRLYLNRLTEYAEEFVETVHGNVTKFLNDPEAFNPDDIFGKFEGLSGKTYTVGVTPTRRLSVRLSR